MPPGCPCGLPQPYDACCGRYHRGEPAPTAERLMRARYSAFALGSNSAESFLLDTWHPSTRPASAEFEPRRTWTGLRVLATSGGGLFDAEGTVAFEASFREGRRDGTQSEHSRFVREDGRWVYLGPFELRVSRDGTAH
ncbi:MAG TPA: YchJ family metal-binding protein [Frankiaceae bacterium]|nr:YchJ family metal-binding protein [Frankiaceae bacterium]